MTTRAGTQRPAATARPATAIGRDPAPPQIAPGSGYRLIALAEVKARVCMCRSSIFNALKGGLFPAPVRRGRSVRWLVHEIDEYVAALAKARPRSTGV